MALKAQVWRRPLLLDKIETVQFPSFVSRAATLRNTTEVP